MDMLDSNTHLITKLSAAKACTLAAGLTALLVSITHRLGVASCLLPGPLQVLCGLYHAPGVHAAPLRDASAELVDVLSAYFPVTFKPQPAAPGRPTITRQDLVSHDWVCQYVYVHNTYEGMCMVSVYVFGPACMIEEGTARACACCTIMFCSTSPWKAAVLWMC